MFIAHDPTDPNEEAAYWAWKEWQDDEGVRWEDDASDDAWEMMKEEALVEEDYRDAW